MRSVYLAFFRHVLPRVGQTIAPNRQNAYSYLPASVMTFPEGEEMCGLIERCGLVEVSATPLTLGIATLYVGTKPPVPSGSSSHDSRSCLTAQPLREPR
jgi:demethylmenaquinone methyltransferase/2-methoxy-6-polyprenyl-1,4-benzoquinol methylase